MRIEPSVLSMLRLIDRTATPDTRERSRWRRALVFLTLAVTMFAVGAVLIFVNTTSSIDASDERGPARSVAATAASIEAQGSPESLVATFRDGRITATKSVGSDESLDADSPFYLGSLSKSLTGVTVARLIDDKQLRLDAPVRTYLPWFRTQSGAYDRITVRHLLNQTSGLPTWAGMVDLHQPDTPLERRVRALRSVDLESAPGSEFHYSNKNFATLALVVEAVTGRSYADVLRREVLTPLGMTRTYLDPKDATGRDVSQGSVVFLGAHIPATTTHFPGALADGYVISTARDLARLGDVLATGQHGDRTYLSPNVLKQLRTPPSGVAPDPTYDSTYGFGVRTSPLAGRRAIWHEGELGTAHANLGVLPESRTGMVVLSSHNGQMFSGDAPFMAGMEALAGGQVSASVPDGGYRATALGMAAFAALLLAWMIMDSTRLARLGRLERRHRLLRSVLPRLALAVAVWAGVFYGLGAAFGLPGRLPLAISWEGAADLTALVLALIGYLVVSAGVVLLWWGRDHAPSEEQAVAQDLGLRA